MTKEKQEHLILQIKYGFLALIVGICVGIVDTVFGRELLAISAFRTAHYQFLLPFLPLTGLLIIWLYQHFSSLSLKGMRLIFETGQKKREEIPLALVPLVMIGFGGLFQTPLAAVFFAMEVIVAGYMEYDALLPALIAAYTASTTSHMLGLEKFAVNITENWNISGNRDILILIILGVVFGLTGRFFSALLQKAKKLFGEKISNPFIRIATLAVPLAILLFAIHSGRYTGLGTNLISASFAGETIYGYDWILKLLFTIFTLAIGFQGGEVTPLFSIGASLGIILGSLLGIPPVICAALGYAAVFGSATNTLFAPILIGLEVFGSQNIIPLVLVCIIAYLVNGNRSIYGAQQKALCRFEE